MVAILVSINDFVTSIKWDFGINLKFRLVFFLGLRGMVSVFEMFRDSTAYFNSYSAFLVLAVEFRLSNPGTASVVNGDIFQYGDNDYADGHHPSSGSDAPMMGGGGRPSQIQVDFIQKMIDEAMEENRYIYSYYFSIVFLSSTVVTRRQKIFLRCKVHKFSGFSPLFAKLNPYPKYLKTLKSQKQIVANYRFFEFSNSSEIL